MSAFEDIIPDTAAMITEKRKSSLDLPTLTASFFAPPPEATTTTLSEYPTATATASLLPLTEGCTDCDGIMPGIMPTVPSHATTTADAMAPPSPTMISGVLTPAATSADAIWYRQPWTVPASGLLCMYSLCSVITLALLICSGKLDWKLNWVRRSSRRRERDDLFDLWRIESMDDRAAAYEHINHGRTRHINVRTSTASAAETEIDFENQQQPSDRPDWYHAVEMQPYRGAHAHPANIGSHEVVGRADYELNDTTGARIMHEDRDWPLTSHGVYGSTDVLVPGGAEAIGRIRRIFGDERYEEQLQAWRLHELQMMQRRMVQAGYF